MTKEADFRTIRAGLRVADGETCRHALEILVEDLERAGRQGHEVSGGEVRAYLAGYFTAELDKPGAHAKLAATELGNIEAMLEDLAEQGLVERVEPPSPPQRLRAVKPPRR